MNGPEESRKFEVIEGAGKSSSGSESLGPQRVDSAFEQELARALMRVDAPEGFAARLMERAAKGDTAHAVEVPTVEVPGRSPGPSPKSSRLFLLPRRQWLGWASGAIAATLVAGAFVGQRVHEQHERRQQADREFQAATRITDQALDHGRQQLAQQGITLSGE
jgi:hypothetical protein